MKAFIIKIKEGCYWLGGFYGENNYDDIAHAKVYHLRTRAEKQCKLINETYNYNAQVVETTIIEGNLEQQLTKKDKQIEGIDYNLTYKQIQIDNLEKENKQLKEQLAEKDKEIERLTSPCEYFINYNNHIVRKLPLGEEEVLLTPKEICDLLNGYAHEFMDSQVKYDEWKRHKLSQYNSKKNYVRQVVEKEIRKQVCDEIKDKLRTHCDYDEKLKWYLPEEKIDLLIDQIEKGE